MKHKTYAPALSFFINLFIFSSVAAGTPDELPNPPALSGDNLRRNDYFAPIVEIKTLEEKYLASDRWRELYLEGLIRFQDYVGDYDEADVLEDLLYRSFPATKRIIDRYRTDPANLENAALAGFGRHEN